MRRILLITLLLSLGIATRADELTEEPAIIPSELDFLKSALIFVISSTLIPL